MFYKIKLFLNNLKQKNLYLYAFLTIVFLHALIGSLLVVINYKKYTVIPFILSIVILYTPFILLCVVTYFEIILYKKYPKLTYTIIYLFNSIVIVLQIIITNLISLYILSETP